MSSHVNLFLDTNVLRNPDFIRWTQSSYHGKLLTSVISYMEFKRQMYVKKKDFDVDTYLKKSHIAIVNLDPDIASIAAYNMSQREDMRCPKCRNIDWADMIIYASIGNPPTLMVTDNVRDFPEDRVKTPQEIMKMYHR